MTRLYVTLSTILAVFRQDQRGATAIEYGLIAAGIAVVVMGAMTVIGPKITDLFNALSGGLTVAAPAASG